LFRSLRSRACTPTFKIVAPPLASREAENADCWITAEKDAAATPSGDVTSCGSNDANYRTREHSHYDTVIAPSHVLYNEKCKLLSKCLMLYA